MKIVVAPDSFKGSLSSVEAANAIENGLKRADTSIEIVKIPMADGGEGTAEAFAVAAGGVIINCRVTGPLGDNIASFYCLIDGGNTAVIEMAAASGLVLVPEEKRDPMKTTSYGTGQLIGYAIEKGCRKIIIGIGGSATNDGGIGMAQALGARFYDREGNIVGMGSGDKLEKIADMDLSDVNSIIGDIDFVAACDVTNPLTGPEGASAVYGPQKGATPEMVQKLDKGLENLASVIMEKLGIDIRNIPGAGAAGGMGAALKTFLNARIERGFDIITSIVHLEEKIRTADFIITGEGKTDRQTTYGKVPSGIGMIAVKHNIPVICISGSTGTGFETVYEKGITAVFSIIDKPMSLSDAMGNSASLLERTAFAVGRILIAIANKKVLS